MKEKNENCGNSTLIFKKDDKYYARLRRCKQWTCPICGEKKKAQLLDSVNYYREIYNMNNMITLTTCATSKELDKQFKKLLDCVSLLSFYRYKSKNNGTLENFNLYIEKMIKEETYYVWLLESKITVNGKQYIPRVHFAILLFTNMKNKSLSQFFTNLGIKGKHYEKYYIRFEKGYSTYPKYVDLKNKNEKLAYLFYKDFEDLFRLIFSTITNEKYQSLYYEAKRRVEYNVSRDEKAKEIAYIRILERTKKGRIHYHILTNFYVPHTIMAATTTIDTFSNDQTCFQTIIDNEQNYENEIGKYIVKYITKDIGEEENNDNIENNTSSHRLITCSNNIKLKLNDCDNKGYKYIDEFIGACDKEFMEIDEDLNEFRVRIMNNSIEQTSLYKERKELVDLVSLEKKRLDEEFKNQYLSSHDFFDRDNYKNERNVYINNRIKKIEEYSQKKVALLDNIYLVRSEIIRHKDSPPIDEHSIYFDEKLDYCQNDFIHKSLTYKGCIALLGGAGTGKSCCIASLVNAIPNSKKTLVCSYTGKATSRLHELIPNPPQNVTIETIHKSCNAIWGAYTMFRNNENNMLPYDVCIIDEISMVDSLLFYCLLNALKPSCKIIVVGDFNQLPPCENSSLESFVEGPDYFLLKPLRRIFECEFSIDYFFTRIHLITNYRSKDKINHIAYGFLDKYHGDIFKEYNLNIAIFLIITQNYKVICNKNDVCRIINRKITTNFPIPGCNGYRYKIGQEIMFLQNDMARNFYNGMVGTITNYDEKNRIITINENIEIKFWETQKMIQPTYAITIHKSQGSEMDNVIVILRNSNHSSLLSYKIAYTAITRAKKKIILMKENGVDEKKLYKLS